MEADFVIWEKIGNKFYEPVAGIWGKYNGNATDSLSVYRTNIVGDKNGIFVNRYTGSYVIQRLDPATLKLSDNVATGSSQYTLVDCVDGILCAVFYEAENTTYTFYDTFDLTTIKTIQFDKRCTYTIFDGKYIYSIVGSSNPVVTNISYATGEVVATSGILSGTARDIRTVNVKVYVLTSGSSASIPGVLYELNPDDLSIIRTVQLQNYYYIIGGDDTNLYIGSSSAGLSKVSLNSFEVVLVNPKVRIPAGYNYDGNKIYCTLSNRIGVLAMVDPKTLEIEATSSVVQFALTGIFSVPYLPYVYCASPSMAVTGTTVKAVAVYQCNNFLEKLGYKEVIPNVSI